MPPTIVHSVQPAAVLVVDDDPAVRDSIARALGTEDFDVRIASDASHAIEQFRADEPDIVLLDLGMPDGSGWDVFEQMSRAAPLVPVVIVTARPGQFALAREAGVAALVEKPVAIPALVSTLRRLLEEEPTTRLARLAHRGPDTRLVRPDLRPSGSSRHFPA